MTVPIFGKLFLLIFLVKNGESLGTTPWFEPLYGAQDIPRFPIEPILAGGEDVHLPICVTFDVSRSIARDQTLRPPEPAGPQSPEAADPTNGQNRY